MLLAVYPLAGKPKEIGNTDPDCISPRSFWAGFDWPVSIRNFSFVGLPMGLVRFWNAKVHWNDKLHRNDMVQQGIALLSGGPPSGGPAIGSTQISPAIDHRKAVLLRRRCRVDRSLERFLR